MAADLTSYKRDLLLAAYRANQANDTPVGTDVMEELETLGQTNTEGGQFYPRLNELVERGFITKTDHPEDARGFTCNLTEEGESLVAQLFVRNATSLDIDIPETELLVNPPTECLRGQSRG
ncbi:helix-turn-helix domain-containing protein [Halorussus salinus]|uniref:helix-turn-helix transcriptional regulator n=1 Tax=Halorussus salinus TaxID=1364935 RepID=UPI00138F8499|nr:helix-turn-helix transcriptional regulator [Halorussus salinus]